MCPCRRRAWHRTNNPTRVVWPSTSSMWGHKRCWAPLPHCTALHAAPHCTQCHPGFAPDSLVLQHTLSIPVYTTAYPFTTRHFILYLAHIIVPPVQYHSGVGYKSMIHPSFLQGSGVPTPGVVELGGGQRTFMVRLCTPQ